METLWRLCMETAVTPRIGSICSRHQSMKGVEEMPEITLEACVRFQ